MIISYLYFLWTIVGDVCYSCEGFIEKNNDALPAVFETALGRSRQPIVKAMLEAAEVSSGTSSVACGAGPSARLSRAMSMMSTAEGDATLGRSNMRPALHETGRGKGNAAGKSSTVAKNFLLGLKQLMREIVRLCPFLHFACHLPLLS